MNDFSAWKVGVPIYGPLLFTGLLITGSMYGTVFWPIGMVLLILGLFALNFFRDPNRRIPGDPNAIVSPADGKVVAVEELAESAHYDGPCKRISIFLNVFNVHVNRAPFDARVIDRQYKKGRFLNAGVPEASEHNEAMTIRLHTTIGPMTVRQIAGLVARRIVCLPNPGDALLKGQRIGMIKFGSRTELYIPSECAIRVKVNDHVRGASTILAEAPAQSSKESEQ